MAKATGKATTASGVDHLKAANLEVTRPALAREQKQRKRAKAWIVKVFPDGFGAWRNQTHAQTKILQKLATATEAAGEDDIKRRTFMHACEELGSPWWPI
jgi:hypothetical protein